MEIVFKLTGNTADLEVYEDHLVYIGKTTAQSVVMGLAYNGSKEYYFCDLTSVNYKAPGIINGYLSFEYPGSQHIQETIWFNRKKDIVAEFKKAYEYIKERIAFYKKQKSSTTIQQLSSAEELKKFKELLDADIITQEEFDAKKKQLLGL